MIRMQTGSAGEFENGLCVIPSEAAGITRSTRCSVMLLQGTYTL